MSDDPTGIPVPPEVEAFLKAHTRTFILTVRKDGSPTGHPMTGWYDEGRMRVTTYRRSHKTRNAQRDERTSWVILNGYDSNDDARAVQFKGVNRVVNATEMPTHAGERQGTKTGLSSRTEDRLKSGKRIVIEVTPTMTGFLEEVR